MSAFAEHAAVNRREGDVPEGTSDVLTCAEFEALNRAGVPTRGPFSFTAERPATAAVSVITWGLGDKVYRVGGYSWG